jgi:hypothetical protein
MLQVPVEERLHIEALRLMVENAKLRKTLNEYSEGTFTLARARALSLQFNPKP